MKAFLAAFQFLTVLPVRMDLGERAIGQGIWFFPVVGLLLGAAVAALDYALGHVLPAAPASVVVVIALLLVSGGLHVDGLADTADGFFSSRPKQQILEIMRDSRSGPMAIAALVCVLGLKMAAVTSVPAQPQFQRAAVILLMALAGRCALVFQLNLLPYARSEGGLGSAFVKARSWLQVVWALALLAAASWFLLGVAGAAVFAGVLLATVLFALHCYRKIGGFTGDTLGAACELTELVPALVMAGWLHAKVSA
ncbi:MAG: adenosylcobinamide-GDP ribazoletransferase [Planctomycetota bacterium]|nr:adenosylcobinamide-GDP ribazoletransferase [Planctomycetota bacterium]